MRSSQRTQRTSGIAPSPGRRRAFSVSATRSPAGSGGGRGLWIVHQLADVVQVIPENGGTRVRVEVAVPAPAVVGPVEDGARRSGREGDLGGGA